MIVLISERNAMKHTLKIEENYLKNILAGYKKAEIRLNDRDYQLGDILQFNHHIFGTDFEDVLFKVTHIHSGLGMEGNYVALSIEQVKGESL